MSPFKVILIKIIKLVYIPCERATYLMTVRKFEKLGFKDRISLRFHMLFCSFCKYYEKEWKLISFGIEKMSSAENEATNVKLTQEQKDKIISKLSE